MQINDAARLARQLMNENGLGHIPFELDRGKTRFGNCSFRLIRNEDGTPAYRNGMPVYQVVKISLSEPLTRVNDETEVRDTILHEIAHALAGFRAGHGPIWRAHARRLGCRPVRCFTKEDVVAIPGKIKGVCHTCNQVVTTFHRMPKRQYTCPKHGTVLSLMRIGA